MSNIKGLLERWSQLEPQLCKRETRPNPFSELDIERFDIFTSHGWQTVYSHDRYYDDYNSPMKIQWAVQQAIIEKGWYFKLNNFLNDKGFASKIISDINKEEVTLTISSNPTEALLGAYLKTLEANR